MLKKLFLTVILLAAAIFALSAAFEYKYKKESVLDIVRLQINNAGLEIELADTPQKRTLGLSGREKLDENSGMLFIFNSPDYHSFWMKDMKFTIDIVWIGKNLKIAGIAENAAPESYPQTFKPEDPAKYVLEVNAGFIDENNIKIGDKVDFIYNFMLN